MEWMCERTPSGKLSRKRVVVDWGSYLDQIAAGERIEIPHPPHMSVKQTRDKMLNLLSQRDIHGDYRIIMGHLYMWRAQ